LEPIVLVATVRVPLPEPVGAQLPEKLIDAVWPADTVTCCEFGPVRVQFPRRLKGQPCNSLCTAA